MSCFGYGVSPFGHHVRPKHDILDRLSYAESYNSRAKRERNQRKLKPPNSRRKQSTAIDRESQPGLDQMGGWAK